jgi:ankyrin repeat protein
MANQSTAASSLMLLLQLIEAKDWQKLNSIFLLNPEKFRSMSSMINSKSSSFNGMTLLHATCRFNPPSKIVRRMIELCPDDVKAVDCLNRTPLHVAAGTGASFNVVDALLDAYPQACDTQDDDGRTPLHLACDRSCILFEGSVNSNDAPNYDIVSNLISASPSSVTLEDDDEMTALEYALMSSGELNVVRMLQKASQKILRQKQEESKTKQQLVGFSPKGKVFTARSA